MFITRSAFSFQCIELCIQKLAVGAWGQKFAKNKIFATYTDCKLVVLACRLLANIFVVCFWLVNSVALISRQSLFAGPILMAALICFEMFRISFIFKEVLKLDLIPKGTRLMRGCSWRECSLLHRIIIEIYYHLVAWSSQVVAVRINGLSQFNFLYLLNDAFVTVVKCL